MPHRCLEGPASGQMDVGQAVAYGLELGGAQAADPVAAAGGD